jgi:hypothetical protein
MEKNGAPNKKAYGEASFNDLYGQYRYTAKIKNLEFSLTKDVFRAITKMKCHYCGSEPNEIRKTEGLNGDYIYNGVDRKDNNLGYTDTNSLPCCSFCNYLKRAHSYEKFVGHIKKIYEFLNEKKLWS